jgi:hypothetical protein
LTPKLFTRYRFVPRQAASVFFTKTARFGQFPTHKVRQLLQPSYSRVSKKSKCLLFSSGRRDLNPGPLGPESQFCQSVVINLPIFERFCRVRCAYCAYCDGIL